MGVTHDLEEAQTQPEGARRGSIAEPFAIASLISVDTGAQRATVTLHGSQPITLPYIADLDFTGYTTVLVGCDQLQGRALWVLGPVGEQDDPPDPPPPPPTTVTVAKTILPVTTGTWRVSRSAWDRWEGGDGALTDLYQGSGYGSGTLIGFAGYGDQVVGLGATSITAATVSVTRVNTGTTSPVTLTVQGSPSGTRPGSAPTYSGDTAGVSLGRGASGTVTLTSSMREALRTGAAKGLALVGGTYAGCKGLTRADGMALRLTYTKST
jgi:hypothetical protein